MRNSWLIFVPAICIVAACAWNSKCDRQVDEFDGRTGDYGSERAIQRVDRNIGEQSTEELSLQHAQDIIEQNDGANEQVEVIQGNLSDRTTSCDLNDGICFVGWNVADPACAEWPDSMRARLWIAIAQAGFSQDPTLASCRTSVGDFRRGAMEWKRAGCFAFSDSNCERRFWREVMGCTGCNMRAMPPPWHCDAMLADFCDPTAPTVDELMALDN